MFQIDIFWTTILTILYVSMYTVRVLHAQSAWYWSCHRCKLTVITEMCPSKTSVGPRLWQWYGKFQSFQKCSIQYGGLLCYNYLDRNTSLNWAFVVSSFWPRHLHSLFHQSKKCEWYGQSFFIVVLHYAVRRCMARVNDNFIQLISHSRMWCISHL